MKKWGYLILCTFLAAGCYKKNKLPEKSEPHVAAIEHARRFTVSYGKGYKIITVTAPWIGEGIFYRYALVDRGAILPAGEVFDAVVPVPVKKIVVTSTTHIPALEELEVEDRLVGFPNTRYISSLKTRNNIAQDKVKELGNSEAMNVEAALELNPDVVVGFAINNPPAFYETLQKGGIPVVYNADWTEETPLGRAEWIKFFALFFNAEAKGDSIFSMIEKEYGRIKKFTEKISVKPTVLSGALYKDVWYLPAGKSWAAQFLNDAGANYLWKDTEGAGSLSLSFESVLEKAQEADFWIAPAQFVSYEEMQQASAHYGQFRSFKKKQVYTFNRTRGETGGTLYYELAPQRPDIVLKDIINIIHPELLPDYTPFFFKPLE